MSPFWTGLPAYLLAGLGSSFFLYALERGLLKVCVHAYRLAPTRLYVDAGLLALALGLSHWWLHGLLINSQAVTPQARWEMYDRYQFYMCAQMTGLPGWILISVRAAWRSRLKSPPPEFRGPFQIRIQDLLIASLGVGVKFTYVRWLAPRLQQEVFFAVWFVCGQTVSLFCALDVCRHDPALVRDGKRRALLIAGSAGASAVLLGAFSNFVMWLAWRRTLAAGRAVRAVSIGGTQHE